MTKEGVELLAQKSFILCFYSMAKQVNKTIYTVFNCVFKMFSYNSVFLQLLTTTKNQTISHCKLTYEKGAIWKRHKRKLKVQIIYFSAAKQPKIIELGPQASSG